MHHFLRLYPDVASAGLTTGAIKHAIIKGGQGRNGLRSELVQVAALCFAALEQHGLDEQAGRAI